MIAVAYKNLNADASVDFSASCLVGATAIVHAWITKLLVEDRLRGTPIGGSVGARVSIRIWLCCTLASAGAVALIYGASVRAPLEATSLAHNRIQMC